MSERSLEQQLGDGVADGTLTTGDAEIVQEFAAFLRDPRCSRSRHMPDDALDEYQEFLGLTDADVAEIKRKRGAKGS